MTDNLQRKSGINILALTYPLVCRLQVLKQASFQLRKDWAAPDTRGIFTDFVVRLE